MELQEKLLLRMGYRWRSRVLLWYAELLGASIFARGALGLILV